MPFSGASDPTLPAHVKRLSAKRRRQWVAVWNSTFARENDEGRAFRAANAAVKEAEMPGEERPELQDHPALVRDSTPSSAQSAEAIATAEPDPAAPSDMDQIQTMIDAAQARHAAAKSEKFHDGMAPFPVTSVGVFGGAESFSDYDEWKEAAKRQDEIDSLAAIFDALVQNIRNDPEMSLEEKGAQIVSVATELGVRVQRDTQSSHDEDEKALDDPATESFWFEAEDFSFTFSRDQVAAEKAATKREGNVQLRASDFADVPDAEEPSTWKLPLVRSRSGGFDLARIGDAITALQPGGPRGQRVQLGSSKARVISRIGAAITKGTGDSKRKTELRERLTKVKERADGGLLSVFKDRNDSWRWLAIHSNEYRDRDGERFASKAHDEYVQWVDADPAVRMPELRVWHLKGSRLGRADLVDHTSHGFMLSSGTFDPGMEHAAKALADSDADLGVSHGFWFDPDAFRDGVYHRYRSFEVSVLPRDRAANETTGFIAGKEVPPMDADKKAYLVGVGGAEWAERVETALGEAAKQTADEGIAYKELEAAIFAPVAEKAEGEEPKPGAEQAPPAAIEPIAAALATVADAVKSITETVERQGEQLAALKEEDAEKIAEAFRPRFDPSKGHVATESKESEVDPNSTEAKAAAEQQEGGRPSHLAGYLDEEGGLIGLGGKPAVVGGATA